MVDNGKMITNKEIKINNDSYYFGSKGKAYKSCKVDIKGYTYTFNETGKIINKVKVEENTDETNPIDESEKTDDSKQIHDPQLDEMQEDSEGTSLEEAI